MLSDISVVEIGNAKVEKNIEQNGKTENRIVKTIFFCAHSILNTHVDAENPKWLHKQIDQEDKKQIMNELSSHLSFLEILTQSKAIPSNGLKAGTYICSISVNDEDDS